MIRVLLEIAVSVKRTKEYKQCDTALQSHRDGRKDPGCFMSISSRTEVPSTLISLIYFGGEDILFSVGTEQFFGG